MLTGSQARTTVYSGRCAGPDPARRTTNLLSTRGLRPLEVSPLREPLSRFRV